MHLQKYTTGTISTVVKHGRAALRARPHCLAEAPSRHSSHITGAESHTIWGPAGIKTLVNFQKLGAGGIWSQQKSGCLNHNRFDSARLEGWLTPTCDRAPAHGLSVTGLTSSPSGMSASSSSRSTSITVRIHNSMRSMPLCVTHLSIVRP